MADRDVADFVRQTTSALAFLERHRIFHLLAGPKSIAVSSQEEEGGLRERSSQSMLQLRGSAQQGQEGRRSLAVGGTFDKEYPQLRKPTRKESTSSITLPSRQTYKIFDPLDRISSSHSLHQLESYLQVPLHPGILALSEHVLLPDALVKEQNSLTVGLIALAMCECCEVADLDIFKRGRLSLSRYASRLNALRTKFPRTLRELEKAQGNPLQHLTQQVRLSQRFKIKEVSLLRHRHSSKENLQSSNDSSTWEQSFKWSEGKSKQTPSLGVAGRGSQKRISLCQL
jgi:hypothetical protein